MSQKERETERLALQGGLKAVTKIEGKGEPKIGIEEFMALAKRFGFKETALDRIRQVVTEEGIGSGPFLANYYSGLPESCVQAFERVCRETFGTKYAVGVSSGTGALHSSFAAAGVGAGKEVICPAIGFYATSAAVVMANGVPVFCDVDESLGMDPAKIEALITERTVALAPTHVMGNVCRMDAIMAVARKHNLKVIEDCAQACGGRYKGQLVGTFGDLGCFSISAYKIVGGGEGGLVITNDERLWDRVNCLAEGGGLWRPVRFAKPRYEGELFVGGNYRMSEMEGAVDTVQMQKMEQTVDRFRGVKRRVTEQLKTYREIVPQMANDAEGEVGYSLRFYPADVALGKTLVEALQAEGINAGSRCGQHRDDWHIYYDMTPLHYHHQFSGGACGTGCARSAHRGPHPTYFRGACPVADDLFDRVINIGLNQWHSETDCDNIARGITKVLDAFCTRDPKGRSWR